MGAFRKFHGKEPDLKNSCKSGLVRVLARFRIDVDLQIIIRSRSKK
jgi:hypothetical protein